MNSRRKVLAGLAALGAGAWLRAVHAQRIYRVGTLLHGTEQIWRGRIAALRDALREHGYVEGRNLVLFSKWSGGDLSRLPEFAAELLREKPDVVVCGPALASAAVQKLSRTIPIVQGNGAGAVKIGLAKSFARPGGNVTGIETQNEDLTPKHLELLKMVAPGVSRVALLGTGKYLFLEEALQAARQAASVLKLSLVDVRVSSAGEVGKLASACAKGGCNGLYVMPDPNTSNWRREIVEQAARLRLPGVYFQPEFVQDGGLISYSANIEDLYRRAAGYVARILKGANPAEMPIERPTKFEIVINLTTAKALGLTIPGEMLARADRVIR
jgi:putative ABC transport system substrate-binding protein